MILTPVIACSGKCIPVQAASGSRERLHRHSKSERYQSLHTSMIGPHGVPVEVQTVPKIWIRWRRWVLPRTGLIRARRNQHHRANPRPALDAKPLELQQSAGSSFEFIESVKSVSSRMRFTFSHRKGELSSCLRCNARRLRLCSAYRYRSCLRGARVDRQPYPLSQPLTSGQTLKSLPHRALARMPRG